MTVSLQNSGNEIDIYIISRDDLLSKNHLVAATVGNCGQNNPQILRNY